MVRIRAKKICEAALRNLSPLLAGPAFLHMRRTVLAVAPLLLAGGSSAAAQGGRPQHLSVLPVAPFPGDRSASCIAALLLKRNWFVAHWP